MKWFSVPHQYSSARTVVAFIVNCGDVLRLLHFVKIQRRDRSVNQWNRYFLR